MSQKAKSGQQRLSRLLRDTYSTTEDEIYYDEASILMARCADALLSEEESRLQYPQLWRYFELYPDSKVEYDMLMALAHMNATGELKTPDKLPPRPDLNRPPKRSPGDIIHQAFPGFPQLSPGLAPTRSSYQTLEPVEISLEQGELTLSLNFLPNTDTPAAWDLLCTVSSTNEQLTAILEFAPLWLQQKEIGPTISQVALSKEGDGAFYAVEPGDYTLHLQLGGREYVVTELLLPPTH